MPKVIYSKSESQSGQAKPWDAYFENNTSFFQKLLMLHRRLVISRAVRYWFDHAFPKDGIFVEAGAGTSESSAKIPHYSRKLIALDISESVLNNFNVLPHKVHGDVLNMPFDDSSINGIWNLGVMEHFTDKDIKKMLTEFKRVLKPNSHILLFWPPWYAPYEIVLNSISWIAKVLLKKEIIFFPDEINLYRNKKRLISFLKSADFELVETRFNWRDLWSYVVVVAQLKPTYPRR